MPTYTELPRPKGHIRYSYSLMSPMNFGIVPAEFHVFVYENVHVALQALTQAAYTIHVQNIEKGSAKLFSEHLLFRGQTDVAHRLLPTRLRRAGKRSQARQRYTIEAGPAGADPREHWGDWFEEIKPRRSADDLLALLGDDELRGLDEQEQNAIKRARAIPEIANLDLFRQRAAVRHYSKVPSALLDVSTRPEVAAFFATGAGSSAPTPGSIGMLWAIDLNFLTGLFTVKTESTPGGEKVVLNAAPERWGDNKKMFEDQGVPPTRMEIMDVGLPFRRPQAQHGRFVALLGQDGAPLPAKTELIWWSIIERRAYVTAFIQDGKCYENFARNITADALLPNDEPLVRALA